MSLAVEVSGFGVNRDADIPYFVLIICAQQDNFQAWTVYRSCQSFSTLANQLISVDAETTPLPSIDGVTITPMNMENARCLANAWLQSIVQNPTVLRTPSMYQFLCAEANSPPPNLEVFWHRDESGEGPEEEEEDEMDMDDMFDQGGSRASADGPSDLMSHVFTRAGQTAAAHNSAMDDDDDGDDLNIKSFENVEAEYVFNRIDQVEGGDAGASTTNSSSSVRPKKISLDEFNIIKVIGKGSFGKVFLVREKRSGTLFAMKVLKKEYIIRKNQVEHTKTERSVLGHVNHPYIVGLIKAFQTSHHLFFILDYCAGGELFFQLGKVGRFDEPRARFYAAQIILALEYMHSKDIIYRDLKPENVLLDEGGNMRLTDFGLSKEGITDHSTGANSFCGTPEYIAPEVLNRKGHGRAVDWWSLGALLYEMITGLPPFYSRHREVMFEKIMKAELTFPPTMSPLARDLLSRLLIRDPKKRLGSSDRDAEELKEHPFFVDINWQIMASGKVQAPWSPTVVGSLDTSQFDPEFTNMKPLVSPGVKEAYFGSLDKQFEGFSFVDDSAAAFMQGGGLGTGAGGSVPRSGAGATMMATSWRR